MRYVFPVLLSVCFSPLISAAEVDQFSPGAELQDSSAVVAAEVNRRIQAAVDKANSPYPRLLQHKKAPVRRRPQCSVKRLYNSLQYQLARPLIGQLESFVEQSNAVDKRVIDFPHSVYRDYQQKEAPTLVLSERIAAIIKLNGIEVGSDKLGHFFTEGRSYFEVTRHLQDGIQAGLLFGAWSESLYFGAQTTGVFSYADLTANFNGLRFWNRILAQQPDPLTQRPVEPYIQCEDKRWVLKTHFSWQGYVDSGWNESVNCSAFRTQQLLQKVLDNKPHCQQQKLPLRYGQLSQDLLNAQGLKILPEPLQPESLLALRADDAQWPLPEDVIERIKDIRLDLEQWRSGE